MDLLDITCPRCAAAASVRFYGPCDACRSQLRAAHEAGPGGAEAVVAERFEPRMNVVPNQVATKD